MPSLAGLLIGGVLPGVIALVLLATPHLTKHRLFTILSIVVPSLAVVLAFIPAPVVVNGKHDLWPVNAAERAIAVALGAGLFGVLASSLHRRRWLASIPAFVSGALSSLAVLVALHPHAVSTPMLIAASIVAGVWVAAGAQLLSASEAKRPGPIVPAMLALVTFASSLAMLFSAIGTYAQQVGALVAILSAATLVAIWKKRPVLGVGALGIVLSILAYFFIGAWQLSRNPPVGALAIAAALPLTIPLIARLASRNRASLVAAWAALALASLGAVGWAFLIYRAAQNAAPAW